MADDLSPRSVATDPDMPQLIPAERPPSPPPSDERKRLSQLVEVLKGLSATELAGRDRTDVQLLNYVIRREWGAKIACVSVIELKSGEEKAIVSVRPSGRRGCERRRCRYDGKRWTFSEVLEWAYNERAGSLWHAEMVWEEGCDTW